MLLVFHFDLSRILVYIRDFITVLCTTAFKITWMFIQTLDRERKVLIKTNRFINKILADFQSADMWQFIFYLPTWKWLSHFASYLTWLLELLLLFVQTISNALICTSLHIRVSLIRNVCHIYLRVPRLEKNILIDFLFWWNRILYIFAITKFSYKKFSYDSDTS